MNPRTAIRAVAITLNGLALVGLAAILLADSEDDGPWLLPLAVGAWSSSLIALLWREPRR
ncbi:MAG: hypothetical protein QF903_15650 [Planctomycetota bacterium]|jgi:hypothetical protein|nr:hypothetical protein [Planctomycetota bacterium]MDP6763106.1 hypothetical protein [Planctomycetota bacterium]MDP6990904.1 hypothetical protein [Planctomycetota bacterium]